VSLKGSRRKKGTRTSRKKEKVIENRAPKRNQREGCSLNAAFGKRQKKKRGVEGGDVAGDRRRPPAKRRREVGTSGQKKKEKKVWRGARQAAERKSGLRLGGGLQESGEGEIQDSRRRRIFCARKEGASGGAVVQGDIGGGGTYKKGVQARNGFGN